MVKAADVAAQTIWLRVGFVCPESFFQKWCPKADPVARGPRSATFGMSAAVLDLAFQGPCSTGAWPLAPLPRWGTNGPKFLNPRNDAALYPQLLRRPQFVRYAGSCPTDTS
jgi:hypothetical protein